MKELLLYPRGGIWYAEDLENGKPDQEVAGVFDGETWLPTSFRATLPVQAVVAELVKLNPGKAVRILGTSLPYITGLTCDRCGRGFNPPFSWKLDYCGNPTAEVLCLRCRFNP